ncbi:MAG: hypothetical protein A3G81_26350 [Betaproteobacteria bacterium RIFCSPLOWO2_12_FULL_65_14]|nr:MAG: hypothetical protein A3G81_26350 [Betaproteobacteria bacterium RIFCSPLOWO2_12_FULL_65_14]
MKARWIRLGATEPYDFEAVSARLAAAQGAGAAPVLLWAQSQTHYLFALIAPRKLAPGRAARWLSWGLAPAIATYRQFGLAAYLEGEAIWLHGRRIADSTVSAVGECAVVASSFLAYFPAKCLATPSAALEEAFRLRLEAQHGWEFDHSWLGATEKRAFVAAP